MLGPRRSGGRPAIRHGGLKNAKRSSENNVDGVDRTVSWRRDRRLRLEHVTRPAYAPTRPAYAPMNRQAPRLFVEQANGHAIINGDRTARSVLRAVPEANHDPPVTRARQVARGA